MNFGPPPMLSDKIPIQAQAIVMDPNALATLRQINNIQLILLYYTQMPFMMLPKDDEAIMKTSKKIVTTIGFATFVGLFANVQIKRVNINFLKLKLAARIPIRLGVMALPFLACSSILNDKVTTLFNTMELITARKNELVRTKNLQKYFEVAVSPAPAPTPQK